jgi:hypothetical protein
MFWKLDLFPSSGEGATPTLLGRLERANLNPKKVSPPHLSTETDPVSEMLCFLVFRILVNGQSPKTQ